MLLYILVLLYRCTQSCRKGEERSSNSNGMTYVHLGCRQFYADEHNISKYTLSLRNVMRDVTLESSHMSS
jgi:hypothetical protein